jgi:hypothetical protein
MLTSHRPTRIRTHIVAPAVIGANEGPLRSVRYGHMGHPPARYRCARRRAACQLPGSFPPLSQQAGAWRLVSTQAAHPGRAGPRRHEGESSLTMLRAVVGVEVQLPGSHCGIVHAYAPPDDIRRQGEEIGGTRQALNEGGMHPGGGASS